MKNTKDGFKDGLRRKKVDPLVAAKIDYIDYKDAHALKKFVSESGKIMPGRITGLNRSNQRMITKAIKRAREIGLLPFGPFTS